VSTKDAINPYYAASPEWFVGRQTQINSFERIASRLVIGKEPNRSLIVFGPVGIGKSSLLRKMEIVGNKHNCYVLRYTPIAETPLTFFDKICKDIPHALKVEMKQQPNSSLTISPRGQQLSGESSLTTNLIKEDQETVLERYGDLFKALNCELEKRNSGAMIFVDQAERLFSNAAISGYRFFEQIAILLRECNRIMLGIALSLAYLTEFLQQCPELRHICYTNEFELQTLSDEEAVDLVQTRINLVNRTIVPSVIKKLIELSGREPFEIVYNLNLLLEKADEIGLTKIDEEILAKATPSFESKFEEIFRKLDSEEIVALRAIATEYVNYSNFPVLAEKLKWSLDKTREVFKRIQEYARFEKQLVNISGDTVYLTSNALWEYLRKKTFEEDKAEALLESYFTIIRETLRSEQSVPSGFLDIMLRSVFALLPFPHETVALKKSFSKMATALIHDPKAKEATDNAQTLYSKIIEMYIGQPKLKEAKEWAFEAIKFFRSERQFDAALIFVEKLIDDILGPSDEFNAIIEACTQGIEIAKLNNNFSAAGEFYLRIAKLQYQLKNQEAADAAYRGAADNYLRSSNMHLKEDAWRAARDLRMASLITCSHHPEDKDTLELIENYGKTIAPRGAKRVITIVGMRAAGVYAYTPSIVLSSIMQSSFGDDALLIDLGMEHELVNHLSSFAFTYLPRNMCLIDILERRRRKEGISAEEIIGLRYDNLLKKGLFQVRGDSPSKYIERIDELAKKGKILYLLPLATDYIAPTEVLKFRNEEVIQGIMEIAEAIKPDFLFITRPGLPKEGRLMDLSPSSLLHSVLDLADDVIVISRGDGQENLNLYLNLAEAICRKSSWELKVHICVNRSMKGLKIPKNIENRICFQTPWIQAWGQVVEDDRIPFIELNLLDSELRHGGVSLEMKKLWERLLSSEQSSSGRST
jgi:hypothetical protein